MSLVEVAQLMRQLRSFLVALATRRVEDVRAALRIIAQELVLFVNDLSETAVFTFQVPVQELTAAIRGDRPLAGAQAMWQEQLTRFRARMDHYNGTQAEIRHQAKLTAKQFMAQALLTIVLGLLFSTASPIAVTLSLVLGQLSFLVWSWSLMWGAMRELAQFVIAADITFFSMIMHGIARVIRKVLGG